MHHDRSIPTIAVCMLLAVPLRAGAQGPVSPVTPLLEACMELGTRTNDITSLWAASGEYGEVEGTLALLLVNQAGLATERCNASSQVLMLYQGVLGENASTRIGKLVGDMVELTAKYALNGADVVTKIIADSKRPGLVQEAHALRASIRRFVDLSRSLKPK